MKLEDITEQPPGVLDRLPIDILANLKDQADAHLADASRMVAVLHGVFERRYAAGLNGTGTSHRRDGGYDIKITVPKNVSWDQGRLAGAVETIKGWGEDPAEYVETVIKVQEHKYDAWPSAIRDLFEPARTVKPGKAKFELSAAKKEAAGKLSTASVAASQSNVRHEPMSAPLPALTAKPGCCEEASPSSREFYIPCNRPAVAALVSGRGEGPYRMCEPCAEHNRSNRGFVDHDGKEAA